MSINHRHCVEFSPPRFVDGKKLQAVAGTREDSQILKTARRQSAKGLELPAITHLARLLAREDRRAEARAMLADIYSWFTEGFDTADLKEAQTLLDELSE